MEHKELYIKYEEYLPSELTGDDHDLVTAAIEARETAYAPYSEFAVGCAVRLQNGEVIIGSNQECSCFPAGQCAERAALFAVASRLTTGVRIQSVAIVGGKIETGISKRPITPCGACRQVMYELEQRNEQPLRIILHGAEQTFVLTGMDKLLPLPFLL